jgi:multiple sugar transport system permease protein
MRKRNPALAAVKYAILCLGAFIMLYPLFWMVISSLRPEIEIFNPSARTGALTLQHYAKGWAGPTGISFTRYYLNSFGLVLLIIAGNAATCSLTAFAFSRLKFTGKSVFFAVMLGTMMLPYHVVLIPRFIMFNTFGWVNTYLPLIVPKWLATDGFFIFLMVQYMRTIPVEYDKSAAIDGCGNFKIFTRIILPLSTPVLITTVIFTFIWSWNDFLSQLLYISKPHLFTVTLALRLFLDATGQSNWGALFAMATVSLFPVFFIFFTMQRYLTDGITAGGLKG